LGQINHLMCEILGGGGWHMWRVQLYRVDCFIPHKQINGRKHDCMKQKYYERQETLLKVWLISTVRLLCGFYTLYKLLCTIIICTVCQYRIEGGRSPNLNHLNNQMWWRTSQNDFFFICLANVVCRTVLRDKSFSWKSRWGMS
jgi:hypothetical protein